ncbi:HPr kinase/phosphorylase [Phenylobacterium sp.]|jgi:serine kinase of HPr protein (carbohydrate metabolism regulator)|uniref:HPr kinase/phosphorylase n=1 Tax=Phenylobacterium sp. TaxID=1871053 RepID=UPI002F3E7417
MIVHAGLIALRMGGAWRGVLIEGPSGAGKTDLALRCLADGFRMVADDRTLIWLSGGRVFGRAPDALAGRVEVRGLDVVEEPAAPFAEVALVARCEPAERIPEPQFEERLGMALPLLRVAPLEASAPQKLRRALHHLGRRPQQAYQTGSAARFLPSWGRKVPLRESE